MPSERIASAVGSLAVLLVCVTFGHAGELPTVHIGHNLDTAEPCQKPKRAPSPETAARFQPTAGRRNSEATGERREMQINESCPERE
ncbi:hypothetical protein HPB50_012534 [Hyalomma asiaticum]|uniref:Uncharacterized protein n=1 Tax=Hyalomma asiaticum TaxID=266040 RepID=A0ACB7S4S0_HYAAI|nr:hypothetical protein HPB50_012534 [Hyalomma asiaticum]